jgi:hypothetical protein
MKINIRQQSWTYTSERVLSKAPVFRPLPSIALSPPPGQHFLPLLTLLRPQKAGSTEVRKGRHAFPVSSQLTFCKANIARREVQGGESMEGRGMAGSAKQEEQGGKCKVGRARGEEQGGKCKAGDESSPFCSGKSSSKAPSAIREEQGGKSKVGRATWEVESRKSKAGRARREVQGGKSKAATPIDLFVSDLRLVHGIQSLG